MTVLARWRNPLGALFVLLAMFPGAMAAEGRMFCFAEVGWTYYAGSEQDCIIGSQNKASEGPYGTGCPATCFYDCWSNWTGDLYRPNGCALSGSEYWTGFGVQCYCEDLPGPEPGTSGSI